MLIRNVLHFRGNSFRIHSHKLTAEVLYVQFNGSRLWCLRLLHATFSGCAVFQARKKAQGDFLDEMRNVELDRWKFIVIGSHPHIPIYKVAVGSGTTLSWLPTVQVRWRETFMDTLMKSCRWISSTLFVKPQLQASDFLFEAYDLLCEFNRQLSAVEDDQGLAL